MKERKTGIIINGFHGAEYEPFLHDVLDRFAVAYCELLYSDAFSTPKNVTLTAHDLQRITWGDYDVDWNDVIPLDAPLVESMSECEVVVLRMMDRIEHIRELKYAERKSIYLAHLRYWNHCLGKNSIDLFLSSNIPHEVYDYVIYCLCRLRGVKTLFFHQSLTVPDSVFLIDDWKDSMKEIKVRYQDLKDDGAPAVELNETYEAYFQSQVSSDGDAVPFYMRRDTNGKTAVLLTRMRGKFVRLKSMSIHERRGKILEFLSRSSYDRWMHSSLLKRNHRKLDQHYGDLSASPDLTKRYIYIALHYQPELTSSPLAGIYVDQILIAELLAACTPPDVLLYVKEHPKQGALSRDVSFYERLASIPSVRIVPKSFDSFDLITNSCAVATATGTVGWEALFREKPVLMFGSFFYQYADGVCRIETEEDCREAMRRIFDGGLAPSMADTRRFLRAVQDTTIRAVADPAYGAISRISREESHANLVEALVDKWTAMGGQ